MFQLHPVRLSYDQIQISHKYFLQQFFKPLSITLTCVGLKFTNAASSSCVRFFASHADLIRCPTAFKSIVTPPPERIIVLNLVYLWIS